uniref:Uncharacterized protein n=1 Tax=Peronospora matthiolae TaxID=2874970 RepID=A0AAV1VAJ7_9STRA
MKELVVELRKSLCGIKISKRLWIQLLYTKLSDAGCRRSESDILLSLSIKDLGRVRKFLVELSNDGGHRLGMEEAIGNLLRSNGLTDANATLTPIGADSNDEQPS